MFSTTIQAVIKNVCKRLNIIALCVTILAGGLVLPTRALAASSGVTNAKVVLRQSASAKSTALQTVYKGTSITVLKDEGTWLKVRYGNYTGYMMKQYVNVNGSTSTSSSSSSSSSSKQTSTQSAADKIRALGDAPGPMLIGDSNTDVKKLQQALQILNYYTGKIDGKYGDGTAKAVKAYQAANGLTADGYAGERTVKKLFGSCRSTSLSTQNTTTTNKTTTTTTSKYSTVSSISKIGSVPGVTMKGYSGTDVVKLQQALEYLGYYDGPIDGDYGQQTYDAVKKYQSKNGLKADGVAGEATIKKIFGKAPASTTNAITYQTEVKDWFKDNVTKLIPKGARFTVKDVATGKTFEMVRWSGANHIDAEPRTANDTAVIKSLYGGKFSWDRRAILIMYNGHVYAASMNGMPHGTQTIRNNNFAGHLCIHFKNSKTHESKKVDRDHQNAVTRASKAKW